MTSCIGSVCWDLRKVSWVPASEEEGWLSLAWWGLAACVARDGGTDGKVVIERLCLSPHVEKPFNSKVIKRFVPELRSRKVFRVSVFLCYLYMSYEHSMYISHIRIMGMLHIHIWLSSNLCECFTNFLLEVAVCIRGVRKEHKFVFVFVFAFYGFAFLFFFLFFFFFFWVVVQELLHGERGFLSQIW